MKKVKRLTAVILSALMMTSTFLVLPVSAAVSESNTSYVSANDTFVTSGDYEYSLLDDGTVEISKYVGNDSDVTIPEEIDGKKVTSIGEWAFDCCTEITTVNISNGVIIIKEGAFSYCENLKSIIIPNTVTEIGYSIFSQCENLTNVMISNGIEWIPNNAFYRCKKLANISIPAGVTEIDSGAFSECESLASISIPDSVINIFSGAFENCLNLTDITIPKNVATIGWNAFKNCSNLSNIRFLNTDNIKYIGSDAFKETKWYNNQPNGVIYIGKMAHTYKGNMPENAKIELKQGTTNIGICAFYDCKNLLSISIPNSVTIISRAAFTGCTGLKNIVIPNGVQEIGTYAFSDCSNLTNITIPNSVKEIGEYVFSNCKSLKSVIIPDDIIAIGQGTFENCSALTNVTIPKKVLYINSDTFMGCMNLKSVMIPKNVVKILSYAMGYYEDTETGNYIKIDDFTIKGYKGTDAETYAKENGFEFISLADDMIFSDKSTGITVSGVMQDDAFLNVAKLKNTFENSVATYDITLQKDGAVIQPDGTITVKIPSNAENCKVMWLKDDGTADDMNAKYTDGCYVFTTNHLSVYALVQNKQYLKGDANQDGIINVNDVTYLQMHIAGKKNTDGSAFIDETNKQLFDCVDMNKDGKLSVADVTALQIHISQNN